MMNQKLQQAMIAARDGQKKEAQFLLTQVLDENPDEVQAWFLLSHLVDSDQKQLAYLKKAVSLDPSHEKAVERLALLEAFTVDTEPEEESEVAPLLESEEDSIELVAAPEDIDLDTLLSETFTFAEDDASLDPSLTIPELKTGPHLLEDTEAAAEPISDPVQKDLAERHKQQARLNLALRWLVALAGIIALLLLYLLISPA